MTNLAGLKPRRKAERNKGNPAYLAAVRELPCVICTEWGMPQLSETTAHHPIHGRFSQRRVPDEMAIPLCDGHHQGLWDASKIALHKEPSKWRRMYGEDHEFTAPTQDKLAHLLRGSK